MKELQFKTSLFIQYGVNIIMNRCMCNKLSTLRILRLHGYIIVVHMFILLLMRDVIPLHWGIINKILVEGSFPLVDLWGRFFHKGCLGMPARLL